MTDTNLDRRVFLQRAGLASLGAATLLAGCGGDGGDTGASRATRKAEPAAVDTECTDLSNLTPSELEIRESYAYIERADGPDTACRVCEFWTEPPAGAFCGGCTLMAGPIHPDASCDSFSEREA